MAQVWNICMVVCASFIFHIVTVFGCHYTSPSIDTLYDDIASDQSISGPIYLVKEAEASTFVCRSLPYKSKISVNIRWFLDNVEITATERYTGPIHTEGHPSYPAVFASYYDVNDDAYEITFTPTMVDDSKTLACRLYTDGNIEPVDTKEFSLKVCPSDSDICPDDSGCAFECDGTQDCLDNSDEEVPASVTAESMTFTVNGIEYASGSSIEISPGNYQFQCTSKDTYPAATITWQFNGVDVQQTTVTQTSDGPCQFDSTSRFERLIDISQCGALVTCSASNNDVDPPVTVSVNIIVVDETTSLTMDLTSGIGALNNDEATLIHGETYTFTCRVESDPDADMEFILQQITSGTRRETQTGSEMSPDCNRGETTYDITFVADINDHLGQTLTCNAVRDGYFTRQTDIIFINEVQVPPDVEDMTLTVDGREYQSGSDVILMEGPHDFECVSARARPAATIEWKVDDQQVAQTEGAVTTNSVDGNLFDYRSRVVIDVDYETCGLVINCGASNVATIAESPTVSVNMLVISPPEYLSPWIRMTSGVGKYSENNATLTNGESYTFSCWIHGADPDISLEWNLQQSSRGLLMKTISNTDETEPDCVADSKQGDITFVADVDEHLDQTLMCSGRNEYFSVNRYVLLYVQVPVFEFEKCVYLVNEASGIVLVRVLRKPNVGDEFVISSRGSVRVKASAISATDTSDFETRNLVLEFAPGETVKVFPIALSDNRDPEGNESFNITLSEVSEGGVLGRCSQANIIIIDDDTVYSFERSNYQVLESDNGIIMVNIIRDGQTDVQGGVDVSILSANAREGVDYRIIGSTSVVFPPGSTNEAFRLALVDDFVVEDTKRISMTLVNPISGFVNGIPNTELRLLDDDATFCLDVFPTEVQEAAGNVFVTCTVKRKGYLQKSVTVYLRTIVTSQRTKRADDFVPVDRPLTFGPGQSTSEEVRVMIPDDNVAEATATFMIELYGIPMEAIGEQSRVEVTIRDDFDNNRANDDAQSTPKFRFERESYAVLESDKLQIPIIREGNLDQPGSVVIFTGSYNEGSNPAGDYPSMTTRIHFDADVSRQIAMIQILDDVIPQISPDRFWVGLREPLGGKIGSPNVASINVEDNDVLLTFENTEYKVAENADSLRIIARRSGYMGPLMLELSATDIGGNGAVDGEDFQIPEVLAFLDGVDNAPIDVIIIDDDVIEQLETLDIAVTDKDDVLAVESVSIIDNDEAENDNADNAQGLSDLSILLLVSGAAVVVAGLIAGIIACALCIRTVQNRQLRTQEIPMQRRPQVQYSDQPVQPWYSGQY